GILVSSLDTGVDGNHPAVFDRWRGHDPRYQDHPEWAFHDPITNQPFPFDDGYHGTHTMGTICGRAESTGDTIGVAPDAEWITAGVVDRGGDLPTRMQRYLLAFQWNIDPDGNPSTTWDVPAVCSNSWGHAIGSMPGGNCDDWYWETLDNMEAAGVCVVFAAGNEGSQGLRNPAVRATDNYNSFAVGAVDANTTGYPIAGFSARGPSICTPDGSEAIKPEVSAPGVSVRSCIPGNSYNTLSGTSMACPHVAGAVALIKQANPNLAPEQIKQILMDTAVDLGPTGEDNDYGWGIIDVYQAVLMAQAMLDGYGYITGRVTDAVNSNPLPATILTTNRPEELRAVANDDGYYGIWVPADTVWNLRAEYPPDYLPSFENIMVAEDETLTVNFQLESTVPVILKAAFGNPEDIGYRSFYCKGTWDDDGFYNPDSPSTLTEMRDDGQFPDQVAGDGIYTIEVKLATDLSNTYQWGVYSENYTDEAFLQHGDNFNITDPENPPVVPILDVNPSGNENDWTLTAFGDNNLNLELFGGYDGNEFQWSGETVLNSGMDYTFRIYPMHANVASYGEGGVGGESFTVSPNYSEEYTIIFDDNLDFLMIDSDHPAPSGLTASDDMDEKALVEWERPRVTPDSYNIYRSQDENGPFVLIGSVDEPDLSYTDETVENYTEYYYYSTAVYPGNIESLKSNTDDAYAITGARLDVNPLSLEVTIRPGESATRELVISNSGDLELIYGINAGTDGLLANSDEPKPMEPFSRHTGNYDKTFIGDEPAFPPQTLGSGGPDEYGYKWVDSDEAGGPEYNWVDITGVGTQLTMSDDDNQGPFPMNFSIDFYGETFNSYRVCSNGFLSFSSTATGYSNLPLPSAGAPPNLLAVFWDDLNPISGGEIYRYESDDSVVVSYIDVPHYGSGGPYTFQVIILSSGNIVFQYEEMSSLLDDATIGIQNAAGDIGLEVAYNQQYVHDELAVRFTRSWLRTEPSSGAVDPGSADTVMVTFDASWLAEGDYTGLLDIEGSDIYHDEDPVQVAVTLHVDDEVDIPDGESASIPTAFALHQNYPNPFNPATEIRYDLPFNSEVRLEIYNILGQLVAVPLNGYQTAGYKSLRWDGTDAGGRSVASGIYFYRLKTGDFEQSKKMMLLK
ncbi:MAG: S8 family serine peptidase, partial [candidate division Zixibacteria bacterium]|nr:S8 family serine peptidase [candidate division Zixibacteria bacterium]